jgi:hypothetical protein
MLVGNENVDRAHVSSAMSALAYMYIGGGLEVQNVQKYGFHIFRNILVLLSRLSRAPSHTSVLRAPNFCTSPTILLKKQ